MKYDWLLDELRLNIGAAEIVAAATGNEGVLNNIRLHKESVEAIEDMQNKLNLWRQDKISRWIPVTERLPEVGQRVLFSFRNHRTKQPRISIGWYNGKQWDSPIATEYDVTHWMPLPEPPKEGTDG